jgi:hypothetical protein
LASVRASKRSVFARACVIWVKRRELAITTLATWGRISAAIAAAFAELSRATRSSGARPSANGRIASSLDSILPAETSAPAASTIATSMNSRWQSSPIHLIVDPSFSVVCRWRSARASDT